MKIYLYRTKWEEHLIGRNMITLLKTTAVFSKRQNKSRTQEAKWAEQTYEAEKAIIYVSHFISYVVFSFGPPEYYTG